MVGEFLHGDFSQQPRVCQALVDDLVRHFRNCRLALAGFARVFDPCVLNDVRSGGDACELLAYLFAKRLHGLAAFNALAVFFRQCVFPAHALKMIGKFSTSAFALWRLRRLVDRLGWRRFLWRMRQIDKFENLLSAGLFVMKFFGGMRARARAPQGFSI